MSVVFDSHDPDKILVDFVKHGTPMKTLVYCFIYGSFKDAVSMSGCEPSSGATVVDNEVRLMWETAAVV
jgi:hypothetical protein